MEPELHSLMEVKRTVVRRRDVGRMVVNASTPRARIRRTHFADYVAYAERQGWNSGSTIAARALDDAVLEILEILGIEDADERAALRDRLYRDVEDLQRAIREREIVAQRDRRRSARRGASTPQEIADELWDERQDEFDLLQFPEDFLTHPNAGDAFDLPSGEVEVGAALMDVGGLLTAGQIRVGGRNGEILEVGTVSRARYLEALSRCHRAGRVHIPGDETCDAAVSAFDNYREELQTNFARLAAQRTPDAASPPPPPC